MALVPMVLVCQLAATVAPRQVLPMLSFPDARLDDTAAYLGYRTRLFQDAARNTVQIYVDNRTGRVVHLLADAENESVGFTVRASSGRLAPIEWAGERTVLSSSSRSRTFTYELRAGAPRISIGWFLLGSMRIERDFQYARVHTRPFASPPFVLPEWSRLADALSFLSPPARGQHLALLGVASLPALRARFQPTVRTETRAGSWIARIVQPSLDARDTLAVEIRVDRSRVSGVHAGDSITLAARVGREVPFTVAISTTGKTLAPLAREEIFNDDFLHFLAQATRDSTAVSALWLEREVRGVQLLSSREKLMAGLPAYATYFGRDMLVSALMMRPIWRPDMSAFAIGGVLRKLSPAGEVSHEEALGGQADREAADEYARLIDEYKRTRSDSVLARSATVLREHRRVRENYHMIDNAFQLPVLEARWLSDPSVSTQTKRAFLLDATDGEPRVRLMLRQLAFVARSTAAYAADPRAVNLISFAPRDGGWASASWRDSNEGYAGGRFAMDVNAIWAPNALASMEEILRTLPAIGLSVDSIARTMPELDVNTPLGSYIREPARLSHAVDVWRSAARHFVVSLDPADVRTRVGARLAALPEEERRHWTNVIAGSQADRDSLSFLALSLDASGQPIAVANSDPATRLFLANSADTATADLLRDIRLFARPYPIGLSVAGVGPVVANDAYASPTIWPQFERDQYHGPRVVWGREVNLFLLGVMTQLENGRDSAVSRELRSALDAVQADVAASGFHSELWSYAAVRDDRSVPVRYATGSDVQLWSTTDLAVHYALFKLRR